MPKTLVLSMSYSTRIALSLVLLGTATAEAQITPGGLPTGVRLGLAFVPTPVFALFLWLFIKGIRSADELERRIQLEALAVAFPLGVLLLTTLGLVQRAVELNFQDWSYNHVWPFFVIFYLGGLMLARRRYA